MAWRVVQQPDGKLAIFSDIVDDFTVTDMTYAEALSECMSKGMSIMDAIYKVKLGIDAGDQRYRECLETIEVLREAKQCDPN